MWLSERNLSVRRHAVLLRWFTLSRLLLFVYRCNTTGGDEDFKCISNALRCDNVQDCPNGEDENSCFVLSETVLEPKQFKMSESSGRSTYHILIFLFLKSNSFFFLETGIVHIQTESGWHVLGLEVASSNEEDEAEYIRVELLS